MGLFLHGMSWLTLVILPVVLILYIQVVFLPYHDIGITWTHRIALLVDLGALVLIGVFLVRAETSFFKAFFRATASNPISFLVTTTLLIVASMFSFFVATVPGEALDRITRTVFNPVMNAGNRAEARTAAGFAMPFFGASSDGALFGIFRRNLHVTDTDLVIDKEQTPGEPSFSLRGRDLRYARLDRSDLHQVDLTNANLDHASFIGADLQNAWLNCADPNAVLVEADRRKAQCSTARNSDFSRAKLQGARLLGIDLTQATLQDALMQGADLSYAILVDSDFLNAHLEKASITGGVNAHGVSFLLAHLEGADLSWAQLQYADLSNAHLQGTMLKHANLQSASLRDSDLSMGTLKQAKLYGADLSGLKIVATDMRKARIWMTRPPETDPQSLADLSNLVIEPMSDKEEGALKKQVSEISDPVLRKRIQEAVAPLLKKVESSAWDSGIENARWVQLNEASPIAGSEIYPGQLTAYLSAMMCKARYSDGSVATGIARRASEAEFRGNRVLIYDRLRVEGCAASRAILPSVMRDFTTIVDEARSN